MTPAEHKHILIIQTASIGDVILITPLIETLHGQYPKAVIDVLVRKGFGALFDGHPFVNEVLLWDKKSRKYRDLFRLIRKFRSRRYDLVINVQRFFTTGLLTVLSGAGITVGFDKNPMSRFFSRRIPHHFYSEGGTNHEVDRNLRLVRDFVVQTQDRPRLYPQPSDENVVMPYKHQEYITVAPASLWFTKQYPEERWISFLKRVPPHLQVYLLGGPADKALCQRIMEAARHPLTTELCGRLSLLQSAALMRDARMNFVNDSAPLHLCSAVNAPATAVFCSTVPEFGFGPLSDDAAIVQIDRPLYCRPCGIHGHRQCPEKHFRCAYEIDEKKLLERL